MIKKVGNAHPTQLQLRAHKRHDTVHRFWQASHIRAACLRHVGAATAFAADLSCDVVDYVTCFDFTR